jgi:hypothetical protein
MAKLNSKSYGKTQLKRLWQNSTQLNSCFMNYFWGGSLGARGKVKLK